MTQYEFDDLNEVLDDNYVFVSPFLSNASEIKKLAEMVFVFTPYMRYNSDYIPLDLNDSVRYASEFFHDFDDEYGQRFDNLVTMKNTEGEQEVPVMRFSQNNDSYNPIHNNSYVTVDGLINIDYNDTLRDEFSTVHETTHWFSNQYLTSNRIKELIGESTSICMEMLNEDFLIDKKKLPKNEVLKNRENRFVSMYNSACSFLIENALLEMYKKNKYIDEKVYKEYLNSSNVNPSIKKLLLARGEQHIQRIIREGRLQISKDQKYVVGTLLACDLHKRISEFPEAKEVLKTLIDILALDDDEKDKSFEVLEQLDIPIVKKGTFEVDGINMVRLQRDYLEEVENVQKVKANDYHI